MTSINEKIRQGLVTRLYMPEVRTLVYYVYKTKVVHRVDGERNVKRMHSLHRRVIAMLDAVADIHGQANLNEYMYNRHDLGEYTRYMLKIKG